MKPARVFAVALPALAIGCGAGSNAPDSHASAGKRVRLAPTLVVTSLDASVDAVSSHDELAAAAAKGRRRLKADVDPVVAMRWHGKAFDEAALMELVAARARWIFSDADVQGVASTEAIGQRYGERFDDIWHAWMALYGAELEDRYGVVVESADVTSERSRGVHALALALVAIAALPKAQSPEETSLTWKGGVFELGAVQRSPPRPPLTEPGAANDRVVETIVASRLGDYYDYPLLSHAPVNIETNAEEGIAPDRFVASGESGIAEVVEGSTRTGKTLRRIIRGKRSVRYLKLRPGSNELGLAHEIHLVRATLDGTALPEAQPLTKTLKVLDGTQEAPIDLTAAYQDARRRFDVSWRSALVAVEPKIAAIKKELASRSQAWRGGGGFPNGGRFESTTDEHEALDPTFEWDAAAGKVTIHFSSRRSVSQKDVYVSANPALETFRCPPGHACAVPPPTVAVPNEQTYSVSLEGTYVFARSGALLSERTGEPAATIDTR